MFRFNKFRFIYNSLHWKCNIYSVADITDIYYPVVDCQMRCSHIYHPHYITQKSIFKLADKNKKSKKEAGSHTVKNFLIDQLKEDQSEIQKTKEVIFIGRSNVGKSSLLNALLDQKAARVSNKPGCTQKLHFYELDKKLGYVVDGPGYGYTDARLKISVKWRNALYDYLKVSTRLCKVYVLINAEHGVKLSDLRFLKSIQDLNLKIQIVLTKIDKIHKKKLFDKCLAIGHQLMKFSNVEYIVHAVSSKSGFGVDHLKYSLIQAFQKYPTRNLQGKEEAMIKFLLENKHIGKGRRVARLSKFNNKMKKFTVNRKKPPMIENEKKE